MNFLGNKSIWSAQNLPAGVTFNNGVFSGTPTVKGNFIVPVTVSNDLGSSTKNVSIHVKARPGTEKFSILQNGVEIEQVTIPELQAMVQNGTAQSKYNCTNTQIVLPVQVPDLTIYEFDFETHENDGWDEDEYYAAFDDCLVPYVSRSSSVEYVPMNFCSFRNVTLQDGTVKPGLILQFDKALWPFACFFDVSSFTAAAAKGANRNIPGFLRWRYSLLRNWLNSSGANWFTKSYDTQKTPAELLQDLKRYYYYFLFDNGYGPLGRYSFAPFTFLKDGVHGFLDFLPEDLTAILQPVKIITQALFDENKTDASIEDPDEVDGVDVDITYDKIFLPSLEECGLLSASDTGNYLPDFGVEGDVWEYWANFFSKESFSEEDVQNFLRKKMLYDTQNFQKYEWRTTSYDEFENDRDNAFIWDRLFNNDLDSYSGSWIFENRVLLRSPDLNTNTGGKYNSWKLLAYYYPDFSKAWISRRNSTKLNTGHPVTFLAEQTHSQPAPAFVIC